MKRITVSVSDSNYACIQRMAEQDKLPVATVTRILIFFSPRFLKELDNVDA